MMQLNSLADVNTENNFAPVPTTELCKRVLFRQSECQVCSDLCPTNAISLPFGPEISGACINCGLCQIACPTETFEGLDNTDQVILEILQDKADTVTDDHELFVHCHQAEADHSNSISVNCLGNMTENALIAMSGADVQILKASTGKCSDCQMNQGMELFKQSASIYTKLSKMFSMSAITVNLREKQKIIQPSSGMSRRDLFRSLGTGVAKQAAKVVVSKEQQIRALLKTDDDISIQKRPSPRREMLKGLLEEALSTDVGNDSYGEASNVDIPWKKMLVDVPNCVGCGVCVNVCPTGALVKTVDDYQLTRTINHSLCTNCNVCSEACPQDVIRFEQTYSLTDIISEKDEVVAVVPLNSCYICGETIPTSEGEVCTTCQKRQVVPMFM